MIYYHFNIPTVGPFRCADTHICYCIGTQVISSTLEFFIPYRSGDGILITVTAKQFASLQKEEKRKNASIHKIVRDLINYYYDYTKNSPLPNIDI